MDTRSDCRLPGTNQGSLKDVPSSCFGGESAGIWLLRRCRVSWFIL